VGVVLTPSRWNGVLLGLFAAFWNAFLAFFLFLAFGAGRGSHGPPPIFLSLHFAAGIFLAYSAVVALLNRTRITLDRDRLQIVRGPVPQRGNVHESTGEIERFAVEEEAMKPRSMWNGDGSTWTRGSRFVVSIRTRDGRSRKTPLGFVDRGHAEYAAGRLAQLLEDIRAAGEGDTPYRGARVETQSDERETDEDDAEGAQRTGRRA
jgi:hypothetical protein